MKTAKQIETKIAQLKERIYCLEEITNAPMQTPGPFVTGRSGYTMGKRLDAENERKANAFRLLQANKRELSQLESILAGYYAGECHLDGRPCANAPSRQRRAEQQNLRAQFMREHIKKGDTVAIAENPRNSITVKRVNAKSVTSSAGTLWRYDEILLMEDGHVMSDDTLRAKLQAWFSNRS